MRIDVLIYDGFDELDALAPFEVLKKAAAAGADFAVRLVTASPREEVVGACGLRLRPEAAIDRRTPPAVIVVPGGGWVDRSAAGARAEAERGEIPALLAELHRGGASIAAVCTGAMLVAAAGLLRGRPAVTHHGAIEDLRAAGAEVVRARVVDDGRLITAGGVTSGLDLALWLVERLASAEIAVIVETRMEYERRGTVWRAAEGNTR
jgi:transcriptional regulator GlxA family with amidase domain